MGDLETILNGSNEAPEAPTAETPAEAPVVENEETEAAKAAEVARDERGRFAPKSVEEPGAQPPAEGAPPAPEEKSIPLNVLLDERRKRQEAEQRAAELEARLQPAPQSPEQQFPTNPPDPFDDAEAYTAWVLQTATEQAKAALKAEQTEAKIKASAEAARGRYQDYPDMVAVFERLATQNPALVQTMLAQENPAEYAYSTAKTHIELAEHGSLDALIEARAAKLAEAKVAAFQQPQNAAPEPSIPESLAGTQSARTASPASVPTRSLEDILNGPRK